MQTEKLEKRGDQKDYLISIPTPNTNTTVLYCNSKNKKRSL